MAELTKDKQAGLEAAFEEMLLHIYGLGWALPVGSWRSAATVP